MAGAPVHGIQPAPPITHFYGYRPAQALKAWPGEAGEKEQGPRGCCPLSRADLMVSAGKGDAFTGLRHYAQHSSDPSFCLSCRAGPSSSEANPQVSQCQAGVVSLSLLC